MCVSGPCDRPPGCGASRSRSRVAQTPGDPESVSARRPPVNSIRAVVGGPARPTASDRAARRMAAASGAMRHERVGCSSRRTPASRRAFKLFKYESLEATCYYAMDRDNLLGCVGQCVHSPLGPDTRPVACSEPTEVRRGGGELVSDTVKWF